MNEADLEVVNLDHLLDGLMDEAEVAEGRESVRQRIDRSSEKSNNLFTQGNMLHEHEQQKVRPSKTEGLN